MSSEVEIFPGLEIISYEHAVDRGLIRNEPPVPGGPPRPTTSVWARWFSPAR